METLANPEHTDEYIYQEKANVGRVYQHKSINCEEIGNVSSYVYICSIYFEMMIKSLHLIRCFSTSVLHHISLSPHPDVKK